MTRRRPGRPPGPGSTSDDVLTAARSLFAEHGYQATTVRAIATTAGVTPAMVHHFFGSKQRLFLASIRMPMDPLAVLHELLAHGPREDFPRGFVTAFVRLWSDGRTGPALRTVLRTALTDEGQAAAVRTFAAGVLLPTVATALDTSADRVATALSIMLGMALARHLVGIPALADLDDEQVVERYVPPVTAALFG